MMSIIAAMAFALAFSGCQKNEEDGSIPLKTNLEILAFADFDECNAAIEKTLELSYNELATYEQAISFNSFGKLSEQQMMLISRQVEQAKVLNDESLSRSNSLRQMVTANSQYLHIETDEDGEESCELKYFSSPYRYIMNADRMFLVDTIYFKVFEGGHVTCGATYYNYLSKLSESDFSTLESDSIYTVYRDENGGRGNYGWSVEKSATSGKERVCVRVWYQEFRRTIHNPNCVNVDGALWVKTWPKHKWCGIWWVCQRTITNNITGRIMANGSLKTGSDVRTSGGFYRQRKLVSVSAIYPCNPVIYIHSASGYGKTPSVTCYMNLN